MVAVENGVTVTTLFNCLILREADVHECCKYTDAEDKTLAMPSLILPCGADWCRSVTYT